MNWVISSSALILAVLLLRQLLRGRICRRLQYALWGVVLLRLLLPGSIGETAISIMNAAGASETVQTVTALEGYDHIWHADDGTVEGYPANAFMPDAPEVVAERATTGEFVRMQTILDIRSVLRWIWLTGAAVLLMAFAISNRTFKRTLQNARFHTYETCPLPVFVTDGVDGPCLFGLARPAIYLPEEVWADSAVCRHAIAHEETHYRHKDHIWAALRCMALALHWYNPLVWVAASLSRQDGELACDEGSIARLGEAERIQYGRTLLALTCSVRYPLCTATTMLEDTCRLRERIVSIAKGGRYRKWAAVPVMLLVLVLSVSAFTGAEVNAAEPTPGAPETEYYRDPTALTPEDFGQVQGLTVWLRTGDAASGSGYDLDGWDDHIIPMLENSTILKAVPNCPMDLSVELEYERHRRVEIQFASDGCPVWCSEGTYYLSHADNEVLNFLVSIQFLRQWTDVYGYDFDRIGPLLPYVDWSVLGADQSDDLMDALQDHVIDCDDPALQAQRLQTVMECTRRLEGRQARDYGRMLAKCCEAAPGSFARVCLEDISHAHREEVIRLLGIAWDMSAVETRTVLENG